MLQRLAHSVDLLICNPPYVESSTTDLADCIAGASGTSDESNNLVRACIGGEAGRVIIDRVLLQAKHLLTEDGDFFLVTISRNDPENVIRWAAEHAGLNGHVALRRRAGIEELVILRFKQFVR